MILSYSEKRGLYFVRCSFDERTVPQKAGFEFRPEARAWVTKSPYIALPMAEYADDVAGDRLAPYAERYLASWATEAPGYAVRVPAGQELLPYQAAGVRFVAESFNDERRSGLCGSAIIADPMGL